MGREPWLAFSFYLPLIYPFIFLKIKNENEDCNAMKFIELLPALLQLNFIIIREYKFYALPILDFYHATLYIHHYIGFKVLDSYYSRHNFSALI